MKYYLFLLLLLFQTTTVFSDDDLLDTVVVTGTTIPVSISDFSSDITVIDQDYINSSKAKNVSELLFTKLVARKSPKLRCKFWCIQQVTD